MQTIGVTAAHPAFALNTRGVVERIQREQFDTHNVVTTEDALKYAPNLMVRKRFSGGRNAPFAGRDFNELQSARGSSIPTVCYCRTCSARTPCR